MPKIIYGSDFGRCDPNVRDPDSYTAWEKQGTEREVSHLLCALAMNLDAQRILEVGIYTGDTTINLARYAAERYVGLDINKKAIDHVGQRIDKSNIHPGVVMLAHGDLFNSEELLEGEGPFDLIYVDANWTNRVNEVGFVMPYLAHRGIIAAHDTGDASPGVTARRVWIDRPNLLVTHLNVPRGLTLIQRKRDFV